MTRFASPEGGHFCGCGGDAHGEPRRGKVRDDCWRLFADREHHFKVRFFGFAGGYFGGSDCQARGPEQAAHCTRRETRVVPELFPRIVPLSARATYDDRRDAVNQLNTGPWERARTTEAQVSTPPGSSSMQRA